MEPIKIAIEINDGEATVVINGGTPVRMSKPVLTIDQPEERDYDAEHAAKDGWTRYKLTGEYGLTLRGQRN